MKTAASKEKPADRQPGYYWVFFNDEWTVGHHSGNDEWTACGTDEAFTTSDWESLGPLLHAPKTISDMLEALIRLREWVRHPGEDDSPENESVIDQAEAAIAKAQGRDDDSSTADDA